MSDESESKKSEQAKDAKNVVKAVDPVKERSKDPWADAAKGAEDLAQRLMPGKGDRLRVEGGTPDKVRI